MFRSVFAFLGAAALLAAVPAFAGDVKVTGVHNCCPGCTGAITKALEATGAKAITVNGSTVSYSADLPDRGVQALFDAGYAGKVEGAKTPEIVGAKGVKGKEIKLEGVHNCCGACTKALNDALKSLGKINAKPRETAFILTSDTEIEAEAVVKALRAAGINARVAR
jgi:periplasmic mercuric ion binding protein